MTKWINSWKNQLFLLFLWLIIGLVLGIFISPFFAFLTLILGGLVVFLFNLVVLVLFWKKVLRPTQLTLIVRILSGFYFSIFTWLYLFYQNSFQQYFYLFIIPLIILLSLNLYLSNLLEVRNELSQGFLSFLQINPH